MTFKDIIVKITEYWSKRSSMGRFGLALFAMIYLVAPQPIIIAAGLILIFSSLQVVKSFTHWFLIAIPSIIVTYALGLSLFILFLFLTTDQVTADEYVMTEMALTTQEKNAYISLIDEVDYYQVDPIMTTGDLGFDLMTLVSYKTGYWFNRNPIESPIIMLSPYQYDADHLDFEIYIYNQFGHELKYYNLLDHIYDVIRFDVPEDTLSIIIQVENVQGEILYDSGEIDIYHDMDYNPNLLAKGGQYDANPLKTFVLNAVGAHLAAILIATLLVSIYNTYQKRTKKVTE